MQGRHRGLGLFGVTLLVVVALLALISVIETVRVIVAGDAFRVYGGGAYIAIDVRNGYDSRVTEVAKPGPHSWKVNDRFLAASLPFEKRLQLYGYEQIAPSDRLDVTVLRDGRREALQLSPTMVSRWSEWQAADNARYLTLAILGLAALAVAAWLVIVQPGAMTWSFYLFTFGIFFYPGLYGWPLPGLLVFASDTLAYAIYGLCLWGFVQFCARFPDGRVFRAVQPLLWISGIIAALLSLYFAIRNSAGVLYPIASLPGFVINDSGSLSTLFGSGSSISIYALGALALALRYRSIGAADRAKIRTVVLALGVWAVAAIAGEAVHYFQPAHRSPTVIDELFAWSSVCYVFVTSSVVYAALHHRVFNIRFVVNRALVYGMLTALFVGSLKIFDLISSRELSQSRLAFFFELLVTMAFAVSLDRLRAVTDLFLRNVLFRERERSLQDLDRIRAVMNGVRKLETIDTILTIECSNALKLTSAGIFRLDGDLLRRHAAIAWPTESAQTIDPEAILAIELRAKGLPVRIDERTVAELNLPIGASCPAVAIPTLSGGELSMLALYGGHRTGEDIDPDELRALREVVEAAAHAYEHLQAVALKDEVIHLRAVLRALPEPAG